MNHPSSGGTSFLAPRRFNNGLGASLHALLRVIKRGGELAPARLLMAAGLPAFSREVGGMICPYCQKLLIDDLPCSCTRPGFSWFRSTRKAIVVAILIGIPCIYLGVKLVDRLRDQSGIQWDEQMSGDWVRVSPTQQSGVEIYRIHIKNQADETLTKPDRTFHQGDKMAATFHFRTQKTGRFLSRVLITGGSPIQAKEQRPLTLTAGGFEQFRSCLIPFTIPADARPGQYQIRLEVEDLERGTKGFWETDFQIQAR